MFSCLVRAGMDRRTLLSTALAAGGVIVSGCIGDAGSGSPEDSDDDDNGTTADDVDTNDMEGYIEPDGEPPNVPVAFECETDDLHRIYENMFEPDDIVLGASGGFGLRIDQPAFTFGETASITLENLTDEPQSSGVQDKIAILVYTENGWSDVRATPSGLADIHDDTVSHEPGEGFEWEMELSAAGIRDVSIAYDGLDVCPDLIDGRYRFVFWGIPGEDHLAVEFDLTE